MIVSVKRTENNNGSLFGKVYVNGAFFGYSLENDSYKIPIGNYRGFIQSSPKFGKKLLYLSVYGRSGILFHNGNTKEDTKGCILVAKKKDENSIKNGLADELSTMAQSAADSGENIDIRVYNDNSKIWIAAAAGLLAAALFFT